MPAAKKKQTLLATLKFKGGLLHDQTLESIDRRHEYRGWHQAPRAPGTGANEGPMYDLYRWDERYQAMAYVGTVFGDEDPRSMRRMTKVEAVEWSKKLHPPKGRKRR